ncbi:OLC1v1026398C1 [Oldenlandia corymbosa var. corymbosa]|uniref:OLC1v1026398C1 n=1 Tax=Oldenlandia corymbosa var. corymbosa TaxID=529605 RepID=A0AAV1C984_OLDCO|nr:OLC1v1026398C1 [Oldenlandia corymbosa var. corymbosa]
MYHPSRGGVRGGRDQFNWEDVKVDKHRENYLGHSVKAPVGRWQKGKDLNWYARDKKSASADAEAMKEEIRRIKEQEEQAMREALGLAPKRATRAQGNRLDKHEFNELVKRGSTAEDLGAGHAEAARVHGLGFSREPRAWEEPIVSNGTEGQSAEKVDSPMPSAPAKDDGDQSEDETQRRKRKHEEKKREKQDRREKRHSRDSDDRRTRRKDKEKRRHDSD